MLAPTRRPLHLDPPMSVSPARPPEAPVLTLEQPEHAAAIEALLDRAFGPGRFTKVSERVREFADFALDLSFCAHLDGMLVGSVRLWRVKAGDQPVVFLGPLAVEASARHHGLGARLVERACAAAEAASEAAVVLVGDLPFFGRIGFEVAPGVILPGPVDPKRVLVRHFQRAELNGLVRAR
jgi:predicted N-acetyltransferase YhbS